MDITLNADLTTRRFTSPDGGTPDFPLFIAGDELRFALRLWDRNADGERVETKLFLKGLKANLGKTVKPPTAGTFSIETTAASADNIAFDSTAEVMQSALGEMLTTPTVTKPAACLWVIKTTVADTEDAPDITVADNKLTPLSFVRIRPYTEIGVWWFEIRLVQTPVAWSDTHEVVLPSPPSVRRLREGGSDSSADDIRINELQSLTIPENFRGTYTLKWDLRETGVLGINDGVEQIAARLNAMWNDGKTRFAVTLVVANEAFIEFVGPLGDAPQELITTEVQSTEAGLPNFVMSLKRPTVYQALRAVESVELPFEVELAAVDTFDEIADSEAIPQIITLKQATGITLYDEGIYPELEASEAIDWSRPPSPKDYVAFTPDQVITGTQNYPEAVGDGSATEFELNHGLDTDILAAVTVRENIAGGELLVHGTDYTVTIEDANNVTVTLIGTRAATPPTTNALLITIVSAGPVAAFQAHNHTQGQIDGLEALLETLGNRLTSIENKLPTTPPTTPEVLGGDTATFTLPDTTDIVPGRWPADMDLDAEIKSGVLGTPRGNALLPAIHAEGALTTEVRVIADSNNWLAGIYFDLFAEEFVLEDAIVVPVINGYRVYFQASRQITKTVTSGDTTLASVNSTNVSVGMSVYGAGLPENATVTAITSPGVSATITLSHAVTAGGSQNFYFFTPALPAADGKTLVRSLFTTNSVHGGVASLLSDAVDALDSFSTAITSGFTSTLITITHTAPCSTPATGLHHAGGATFIPSGMEFSTGMTPTSTTASSLPGSPVAGTLYKATADIALTGGMGIRSSTVKNGGYFGYDGRLFYRLTQDVYPQRVSTFSATDFERELWMLPVSSRMLRASQRLVVDFELEIGLLNRLVKAENRSRCQWLLVIEHGTTAGQTTPAPVGENLTDITWNSTPLFTHRFVVSESPMVGKYGVSLAWNGEEFTAKDVLSFGKWEAADGDGPASNEFALRARLVQFDTENSITTARGLVFHRTRKINVSVS